MELESALLADARAAFARSIEEALGRTALSQTKAILAVDASHFAIFELLAYGSGGSDFYDKLGISRLLSVQLQTGDTVQLQRQLSISSHMHPDQRQNVAIVAPPLPTVAKHLADALRPLEFVASRRCAILWLPVATSDVSLEMERQGVAGFIHQANLALSLIPIDRGVAALCLDSVFSDLYVKGDSRALTSVVKSILAIETHTGKLIVDVTSHGFFAERVKTMLELAHRQAQRLQSCQTNARDEIAVARSCTMDKLVVIDRMEDPLSMLLTPMTYEGLLDALVGVNHGVVTYEKEEEAAAVGEEDGREILRTELEGATSTQKVVLNYLDVLFDEVRDVNFNLVSDQLVTVAKDLASQVRGSSLESMSGVTPDSQAEFQKVKALLAKAPHLIKKKRSLAHHLQLVQRVRELSTQFALRGCVETEMTIMSAGPKVSSAAAKDVDQFLEEAILREPPLNLYDVLKLLCLCSLVRGGLKPDQLAWYRQQLCHTYGHRILPLLAQLEKMDLLSLDNRFDFPKKRKQLVLMRGALDDEETRHPVDIHFMFPYTGYAPMSIRLLQDSLGMKYKMLPKDSTSSLLRRGSGSGKHASSQISVAVEATVDPNISGKRIHVLVYYIGGVTIAELTALRFLNQQENGFTFFIAATSICNGSRLLRAIY
ncbi:hypothetical protein CCR75_006915 [Bremia lactucae]|uniref:Sec1-like protein n=1 Tax=Bremia lactucae TaxID=4779 RepID=A0A976NYB7_BRELC|nr:hypothetical protein CCR75_006913 [Bremia lactucae]TDH72404.1 hypothetical protein CCR75_006915 [Bremia lactucae]